MFIPLLHGGLTRSIAASNTANATSTATTAAHTFSSQSIGDADSSRIVVVAVGVGANGNNRTIASVTVGGAALAKQVGCVGDNSGTENFRAEIWSAAIASGTTGDVVVTASGTIGSSRGVAISVFRFVGDVSATANATNSVDGDEDDDTTAAISLNTNTQKSGYVIAAAIAFDPPPASAAWTNLTELTDAGTGNVQHSVASLAPTTDETPRTISVDFADGGYTQAACIAAWYPS